ncbi:NUDIX domain-containing protein [Salinispirillum marinum]|uniref:ADP-ribose pyrophosphatase n=2 Tax=Saccharospirillaceae TaxID=255527 RepID=A0ABV8BCS5_9GAMM
MTDESETSLRSAQHPQRFSLSDVEIVSDHLVYKGFYEMRELVIRHACFSRPAITIKRELMNRPDAVVVMLIDPREDTTILIEQFRVGAQKAPTPWLIECVAGLIEPNEQPEEVARREALEEAGLTIGRLKWICNYFPSPGGTNEKIFLYVGEVDASQAGGVHGLAHEGEDILVHRIPLSQALNWLQAGHINNAASIIALQWLQLNLVSLKNEWGFS